MNFYLIFKSLHLIAVISWMAGLLYLPRIFVYHTENSSNIEVCKVFKVMERKLYFYIMYPAMLLSWIFGLALIHSVGPELLSALWMQVKFFLVVILTAYHFYPGSCLKAFKDDKNTSKILINTKDNPNIKNKFKFDLSGFKKFILFIYFSLIAIFLLYQFIKTEIDKLNDR